MVVGRQRQVDDTHGDVSERQVGDKHVRGGPHLACLRHGDHDERVTDDPEENDDEIEEDDDGGERLVLEHVELLSRRHQRGDVQLVEVTVEVSEGQRAGVVAEAAEALEAREQVEGGEVPHVAVVAARRRRRRRRVCRRVHGPTTAQRHTDRV